MCGLFGMQGPGFLLKDFKILKDLGIFSQARGLDGAGVYQVKSTQSNKGWLNHEDLYKTYTNFSSLYTDIEDNRYKKGHSELKYLFNNTQADLVMCHVRAATQGSIQDHNAHPFNFSNIVGAHNGTLRDKKYDDKNKTDSELMFADINNRGLVPVLKELDKYSAYAITMYDRRDRCLYFARNGERTLSFAFLEDRSVMYWASEGEMLKYALGRAGEKAHHFNLRPFKILKVYAGDITRYNIEKNPGGIHQFVEELPDPFAKATVATITAPTQVTSTTVKSVTKVVQQEQKVIQFPRPAKKDVLKAFHGKCKCGKHEFNVVQMCYLKKGQLKDYRINEELGEIYCSECDPVKKAVQTIVG